MIRPGGIEFTVIPRPPTSRESPLAHECSAALAANAPLTPSGSDLPVMLTMRPQPRSSMPASRWPVSWRWRVKLSVSASSHCSSEASLPNGRLPPALLTRISTAPSASVAAQAICAGASGSMKSAAITAGRGPAADSISSASSSRAAARRAVTASRTPSRASAAAIPRPMPLLAPVTSAPLPSSRRSPAGVQAPRPDVMGPPVRPADRVLEHAMGRRGDRRAGAGGDAHVGGAGAVAVPEDQVSGLDRRLADRRADAELRVARARQRDAGPGHRPLRQARAVEAALAGAPEHVARADLRARRGQRCRADAGGAPAGEPERSERLGPDHAVHLEPVGALEGPDRGAGDRPVDA